MINFFFFCLSWFYVFFPSLALGISLPPRQAGEGIINITNSSPALAISNLYNFALGVAALVAFGLIVYSALQYTTTESSSVQHEAKSRIYQALLGLLLLLGASIVLRFINPDLKDLKNPEAPQLPEVKVTTSGMVPYWTWQACNAGTCTADSSDMSWGSDNGDFGSSQHSQQDCQTDAKSKNGGTEPTNWRCIQKMKPAPPPLVPWVLQTCNKPVSVGCTSDDYQQGFITQMPTQFTTKEDCEAAGAKNPGTEPTNWRCIQDAKAANAIPAGETPSSTQCSAQPECVQALQDLKNAGIGFSSSKGCNDLQTGCTSFIGSAVPFLIERIKSLQAACVSFSPSCQITVTGGTEPGHKSHGPDKVIADLALNGSLNSYIYRQIRTSNPTSYKWYKDKDQDFYYYLEVNHWHVCFSVTSCNQAGDLTRGKLPVDASNSEDSP